MASVNRRGFTAGPGSRAKSLSTPQTSPSQQQLSTTRKRNFDTSQITKNELSSPTVPKRRKLTNTPTSTTRNKAEVIDLTGDDDDVEIATPSKRKNTKAKANQDEEKRLRMFRKSAPLTYLEKLHRAQTQRYEPIKYCDALLTGEECSSSIAEEAERRKLP